MFVALRLAVRRREILDVRDRSTAIMLRMRSVALGTYGRFAAVQYLGRFQSDADMSRLVRLGQSVENDPQLPAAPHRASDTARYPSVPR